MTANMGQGTLLADTEAIGTQELWTSKSLQWTLSSKALWSKGYSDTETSNDYDKQICDRESGETEEMNGTRTENCGR